MKEIILSLFDLSGVWSDPYLDKYEVIQVDLQVGGDAILWPSEQSLTPRLPREFGDIRDYIGRVHGVLAAPMCEKFSGSGACHPRSDDDIRMALALVDATIRVVHVLKPQFWCLENTVGKLGRWLGDPAHTFNPCDYGDPYTKRTCLWGEFTMPQKNPVEPTEGSKMHRIPPGPERKNLRSKTPEGFAQAFRMANP